MENSASAPSQDCSGIFVDLKQPREDACAFGPRAMVARRHRQPRGRRCLSGDGHAAAAGVVDEAGLRRVIE
jgi:hypothetical protein